MKTCRRFHDTPPNQAPPPPPAPLPPCRNGEACGQHPARGVEPAAGRRSIRLPQHPAHPAGAAHHPPANAGGLHAGGAARPHAVVPAPAHRQPIRAHVVRCSRLQMLKHPKTLMQKKERKESLPSLTEEKNSLRTLSWSLFTLSFCSAFRLSRKQQSFDTSFLIMCLCACVRVYARVCVSSEEHFKMKQQSM